MLNARLPARRFLQPRLNKEPRCVAAHPAAAPRCIPSSPCVPQYVLARFAGFDSIRESGTRGLVKCVFVGMHCAYGTFLAFGLQFLVFGTLSSSGLPKRNLMSSCIQIVACRTIINVQRSHGQMMQLHNFAPSKRERNDNCTFILVSPTIHERSTAVGVDNVIDLLLGYIVSYAGHPQWLDKRSSPSKS